MKQKTQNREELEKAREKGDGRTRGKEKIVGKHERNEGGRNRKKVEKKRKSRRIGKV